MPEEEKRYYHNNQKVWRHRLASDRDRHERMTTKQQCMGCGNYCFTLYCDTCAPGREPFGLDRKKYRSEDEASCAKWNGVRVGGRVSANEANPRAVREYGRAVSE